jgi:hypothetical protein
MSRRARETALLIVLGLLAGAGVKALDAGTPLRIAAGLALLPVLPWLAASRLGPLSDAERPGERIAAAGAIAVAVAILLGLLLTTTAAGIETDGIVLGMLVILFALAVGGVADERPIRLPTLSGRLLASVTMLVLAGAIAVGAFAIARDRALSQARHESSYAAFLVGEGSRLGVGLSNPRNRPARFVVSDPSTDRRATRVIAAGRTEILRGFLAKPPPLRPIQRLRPKVAHQRRIEVTVFAGGHPVGAPLELSTYAP